jgi:hypothetical protein
MVLKLISYLKVILCLSLFSLPYLNIKAGIIYKENSVALASVSRLEKQILSLHIALSLHIGGHYMVRPSKQDRESSL